MQSGRRPHGSGCRDFAAERDRLYRLQQDPIFRWVEPVPRRATRLSAVSDVEQSGSASGATVASSFDFGKSCLNPEGGDGGGFEKRP